MTDRYHITSTDLTWKRASDEASNILSGMSLPSLSETWPSQIPWSGESYTNVSSIDGKGLIEVPVFGSSEIEYVVEAANKAADGPSGWAQMHPTERRTRILDFRARILAHADELAMLDCLDVGKPYQIAKSVDIGSAARSLEWYAELGDKLYGDVAPTSNLDVVVQEPLGVVAAIVPWNYPLMIAAWKFAPILAAGNAVILKPAEQSPLSAMKLQQIANESELPDNVFNVVTGDGPTTGAALICHERIHGVGFTGSSETGKIVIAQANRKRLKPVSLECGGKSPAILFEDCDIEKAVKLIAAGIFYNAGQSCNAPTRILAHTAICSDVVQLLRKEAGQYEPNNPLSGDSPVGAILDATQFASIAKIVESSVDHGAEIVSGGMDRKFEDTGGYFMSPTILTNVAPSNPAFQEEIFGPVMPITSFETDEDAIRFANDSRYGLWANVFTDSLERSLKCGKEIKAGTVALNVTFGGDITTPFGGYKDSGVGRDRSVHALEKYTNTKHISLVAP